MINSSWAIHKGLNENNVTGRVVLLTPFQVSSGPYEMHELASSKVIVCTICVIDFLGLHKRISENRIRLWPQEGR